MEVVKTVAEVRDKVAEARGRGKSIGFVPTMGYLHRGHLSLVEISKRHTGYQVMSIFVNRMQFNDPRDYESYPIDLQRDFAMARDAGVDLMFTPEHDEMYKERLAFVDMEKLTDTLCGATRPGHFRGVLTVVCKLLNIVQADVSVFGQKDIQQAVVIRKMAEDLNIPTRVIVAPIVREDDGLAMSSRNKNLTPEGRKNAVAIHESLAGAEEMLKKGERRSSSIVSEMERIIRQGRPDSIDYIAVVRYRDLARTEAIDEKSVIAVAAYFGKPRLIDNMLVEMEGGSVRCVY